MSCNRLLLDLSPSFPWLYSRIVFYHRVSPANALDLFTYLVLVECWNVTPGNLIRALDFVQRMRVERLNGYISIYRDLGLEEGDSNYHSGSQGRRLLEEAAGCHTLTTKK